jgi:hypothetical protein
MLNCRAVYGRSLGSAVLVAAKDDIELRKQRRQRRTIRAIRHWLQPVTAISKVPFVEVRDHAGNS